MAYLEISQTYNLHQYIMRDRNLPCLNLEQADSYPTEGLNGEYRAIDFVRNDVTFYRFSGIDSLAAEPRLH